jgi:hypothetical protein
MIVIDCKTHGAILIVARFRILTGSATPILCDVHGVVFFRRKTVFLQIHPANMLPPFRRLTEAPLPFSRLLGSPHFT